MKLNDITILNIKSADYLLISSGTSKNETINLMQNADLTKKSRTLKIIKIHYPIYKCVNKF